MQCVERDGLDGLFHAISKRGYTLIGPTVRGDTIVFDSVRGIGDLPQGIADEHDKGRYRLVKTGQPHLFNYACSPQSIKPFLNPPRRLLWRARGNLSEFAVETPVQAEPRYAFVGVRPCELQALALLDKVFLEGDYVDPVYRSRREQALVVAVNCTAPSSTCFCTSMGTGPRAASGFDLALTEVAENGSHYFVVETGSAIGRTLLDEVPHTDATPGQTEAAAQAVEAAANRITRTLNVDGLREVLHAAAESPRWEAIAQRCLACGNCTMVCPTCFCSTVDDLTSLTGDQAERWRVWDSCFTMEFSHIHGGSVRKSCESRYRQWLTHKLASWHDQFGSAGCVGCGRCITWCPVGIDLTEEAAALRDTAVPG